MISQMLELYARRGISLKDRGLNEAALPIVDAEEALTYFGRMGWVVLGGDIYLRDSNEELKAAYVDWFYTGSDSQESIDEARQFLMSLKNQNSLVVFVLRDK